MPGRARNIIACEDIVILSMLKKAWMKKGHLPCVPEALTTHLHGVEGSVKGLFVGEWLRGLDVALQRWGQMMGSWGGGRASAIVLLMP